MMIPGLSCSRMVCGRQHPHTPPSTFAAASEARLVGRRRCPRTAPVERGRGDHLASRTPQLASCLCYMVRCGRVGGVTGVFAPVLVCSGHTNTQRHRKGGAACCRSPAGVSASLRWASVTWSKCRRTHASKSGLLGRIGKVPVYQGTTKASVSMCNDDGQQPSHIGRHTQHRAPRELCVERVGHRCHGHVVQGWANAPSSDHHIVCLHCQRG